MPAGQPVPPVRSLKSRALQLLAQREHSRVELHRKLAAHAERIESIERIERDARQRRAIGLVDVGAPDAGADGGAGDEAADRRDRRDRAVRGTRNDGAESAGCICATPQRDPDPPSHPADRAAVIDSLLDWLEANQYLSDARFVESRMHARIARFGNARIRFELAQHHAALPADAEQRLRETEFERARAVWARKYEPAATDPASRARQSRFLAGRGFSAEVIARVLREAGRASKGARALDADD